MNNAEVNINQPSPIPSEPIPGAVNPFDKVKSLFREYFLRFYSNKKIFLPVTVAFGLVILTLVIGLIFGNKSQPSQSQGKPTPTPTVSQTPSVAPSADFLTTTGNALFDLNGQINNFDVKQSKLTPPQLNFNISF